MSNGGYCNVMGDVLKRRILQERFESPAQEAVLNLVVAAGHVGGLLERVCEARGVSAGQYNVLRILKGAHPNGYPRGEISRRLLDRAPDVTRLIDRLRRRGLVERVASPVDRRLSITRITPRGLALLAELKPAVDGVLSGVMDRLGVEDCQELSRLCEKLYDAGE
jgi:DNA-binding MarR family transcriptional regulator